MSSLFDPGDPTHDKARRMLETEIIAWFTTVGKDGSPRAVPVWFWWDGEDITVLSKPDAGKAAHVRRGAPVLVHLNAGGRHGDDVVILHGRARIAEETAAEWLAPRREAYLAKYAEAIEGFGAPADAIAEEFSTVLIFTPERVQAW
jgi:PPOX class probable F420-dependent enzyme